MLSILVFGRTLLRNFSMLLGMVIASAVVVVLKTILAPILPHTAQQLHEYLGYDGQLFGTQRVDEYEEETRSHRALTYDHNGAIGTWAPSTMPSGQTLHQPAPLFKKLDKSVIEEEYARQEG